MKPIESRRLCLKMRLISDLALTTGRFAFERRQYFGE